MEEILKKIWQWLKESPKWAKIALPLILCAGIICVLLSSCGTIGWISAKDTANATISITNSPQTDISTDAEVSTSTDVPISVPSISIFDGSESAFQKLENGFYVIKSMTKTVRYEQNTQTLQPISSVPGSNESQRVLQDQLQINAASFSEDQFLPGHKAQFPQMRVLYRKRSGKI